MTGDYQISGGAVQEYLLAAGLAREGVLLKVTAELSSEGGTGAGHERRREGALCSGTVTRARGGGGPVRAARTPE